MFFFLLACATTPVVSGLGQSPYVSFAPIANGFALAEHGTTATIHVDAKDWPGVTRVANDLQADVARVTGLTPAITHDPANPGANVVIVGTIGRGTLVDQLVAAGKIDPSSITGQWESFLVQVVPAPLPGVTNALVIAGSDKRGTIYGVYDVSEQIGVSPWYWWGDVPADHHDTVYIAPGAHETGPPSVKYRGIFLNDEAPDLDELGPGKIRGGAAERESSDPARHRELRPRVLRTDLRGDAAPEGELSLAGDVEQRVQ